MEGALALARDISQRPNLREEWVSSIGSDPVFHATESPLARLVAAEAFLASTDAQNLDLAGALLDAAGRQDAHHPLLGLLRARHALLAGGTRQSVLDAWRAAREAAPDVPLPSQDVERFRGKHGGGPDLDALLGS